MGDVIGVVMLLAKLCFVYLALQLLLKYKIEWIMSIRSIATIMIAITFCYLAVVSKIEAKDFMLIASLVFNYYYLVKDRMKAEEETKLRLLNNQQGGQK
jgi:glycerol-3-phosphate acyltransferase PlsY